MEVPRLVDAIAVAKRLNRLLRRKNEEKLGKVLEDAANTPLAEFASGLKPDRVAVQAVLDTPWTTSSAEGQINRVKTIKRSMYGRAGFDLLRVSADMESRSTRVLGAGRMQHGRAMIR